MNTDRLAKMYHSLTARERLPLLLAAEKRGDEVEHQRLQNSAPVLLKLLPDYQPGLLAVNMLALLYLTEQLDYLANYWHAVWRLTGTADDQPEDWLLTMEVNAYVFSCNAAAWRQFCQELNLDAEQLITGNYCGWILGYCTVPMPDLAPSRGALRARLQAFGVVDPEPVTADTLLARWRDALAQLSRSAEAKR